MAASVWKGHITFGLISIPVRLLRAARSERVPLRELYQFQRPSVRDEENEMQAAAAPVHGELQNSAECPGS
jgi:non-homologous end joining protein Ku